MTVKIINSSNVEPLLDWSELVTDLIDGHSRPKAQIRDIIEVMLPLHFYDLEGTLRKIEWVQMKNYRAYKSHRKKKFREIFK